ncbi:P-loop containing nucleoside triphosphate hydrolase protein [Aspergillus varians]
MYLPTKRSSSTFSTTDRPSKTPKPSPSPLPVNYFAPLVIHRVICRPGRDHDGHPSMAEYFDTPRLFRGDSRASHLRGENPLEDTEEYLKEHDAISLICIRHYDCNLYHSSIGHQFEELEAPLHPMNHNIRRHFYILRSDGDQAIPESEEIGIVDENLQEKVHKLIKMPTGRISTTDRSQTIDAVVDRLYIVLRQSCATPTHNSDHRLVNLLRNMGIVFEQEYGKADSLFSRGCVTKSHLAKLFWPNQLIVTDCEGYPRACLVKDWPAWRGCSLILPCRMWSFDGQFFEEQEEVALEWTFGEKGEVPITKLSAYPIRFDEGMQERLLKRGATFWQCRNGRFISYSPPSPVVGISTSNPRYMLDAKTYRSVHTNIINKPTRSYLSTDIHDGECPPDDTFQLLLPPTIQGFGFHDKKWISVSVENIGDIEWNAEAFNHLVLKNTKKELIRALVGKHTVASEPSDVIEGKGNGLILLLHGGPGTGKTLTAESMAELTHRPLYRVTCGDIGINAEGVERYLASVLYLGTRWQCVVLLDEADVFLEERTQQDLKRNALISVFLRVLEYYSGILVLTSNRIGTLDEAFKSRVQLTLHYPSLDEGSRRRIWSNFITRLRHSHPGAKADQILDNIDELAQFKLNGREIRNSITTAMLLAEFRGQQLQYCHLAEVIDVSNEFEQYLHETHGHSASEWAREQRIRKD